MSALWSLSDNWTCRRHGEIDAIDPVLSCGALLFSMLADIHFVGRHDKRGEYGEVKPSQLSFHSRSMRWGRRVALPLSEQALAA